MFQLFALARKHLVWALLAGLALRLFFVLRFPTATGDTVLYEQLARNWLDHHVYGMTIDGRAVAADLRAPGYPAFIALLYLIGRSDRVILLAQVIVDLGTCVLAALLAAELAPAAARRRVAIAALWLAALCPFLANYTAVPLTEVLAAFLTMASLLCIVRNTTKTIDLNPAAAPGAPSSASVPWLGWLLAGLIAGLGTLVRPETPLLLAACGFILLVYWRRRPDQGKLVRAAALMAAGLVAALLPWGLRNWITLHDLQFLAPRHAEMPGEFVARGFYDWTRTWLWRYADAYRIIWSYDDGSPFSIDEFPDSAFDSEDERDRAETALNLYNDNNEATPQNDAIFAQLAAERTRHHPLRTYATVPFKRAIAMWFTPRVDLLPLDGHVWPLREQWETNRADLCVTLFFELIDFFYVGLAAFGVWVAVRSRSLSAASCLALAMILAYIVLRTAYLTRLETSEPRYVVLCFPMLCALAALTWLRQRSAQS